MCRERDVYIYIYIYRERERFVLCLGVLHLSYNLTSKSKSPQGGLEQETQSRSSSPIFAVIIIITNSIDMMIIISSSSSIAKSLSGARPSTYTPIV